METIDLIIYNVDTEPFATVQYFIFCQDKHITPTMLCNVINSQNREEPWQHSFLFLILY